MEDSKFLKLISQGIILADGAMGTMLHTLGIPIKQCFDALNLTNPTVVTDLHKSYVEAGAQIILTNTFGANRYKLAQHGFKDQVCEINHAGVELAHSSATGSKRTVLVAGDVGPLGVRIAPFGRVQAEEAIAAFSEQTSALASAGVDLLVLETMSDLIEVKAAIRAAQDLRKKNGTPLPVVASMTFTRDDRTILGDTPENVAKELIKIGADVIGVNCSGGPAQLLRILKQMRRTVPDAYFWVKPNAGWPEQVGERIMYPATADYFGEYALAYCQAGANIVGGCCGTTPQHIASMRSAIDKYPGGCDEITIDVTTPEVKEQESLPVQASQLARKLERGQFTIAVEMDPPRGLSAHKLIAGASLLSDTGADVINVADSPMARMRMSAWAVCDLIQRQVGIETTLHFPTRGRNLLRVQGDLLAAHALGIRNIFVVMGDPTSIGDYPEAMDNYDLVPSGLIKLIKQGFNLGIDHSGASIGQPTNFFVGAALNLSAQRPSVEYKNLQRKLKAGADFFLTQPIYQAKTGLQFIKQYEVDHGPIGKPILVGILPLVSPRHANFLHHEVPGIFIPDETRKRMEQAGDGGAKVGIKIAIELTEKVKPWAGGIYIMPQFHRYDLVAEIIEAVKE